MGFHISNHHWYCWFVIIMGAFDSVEYAAVRQT